MTAPTTPAKITLADGSERTLRFTNKALKVIKEQFGASIFKGDLKAFFDKIDEDSISKILALAIRHPYEGGDLEITEEKLDELVDAQMLPQVVTQLLVAMGASMPAEKNAKTPEAPIPAPETPATTVM